MSSSIDKTIDEESSKISDQPPVENKPAKQPAAGTGGGRGEKRGQTSARSGGRKQGGATASTANASASDVDGCLDLDAKKAKKEGKSSSPLDPATTLRQAYQTFPASSYLQGLTALAHPYASLFSADPTGAGNFLSDAAAFAGYQQQTAAAASDLLKTNGVAAAAVGGNSSSEPTKTKDTNLLGALSQMDASSVRQLVIGYREAAALLNKTAEELESYLCAKK